MKHYTDILVNSGEMLSQSQLMNLLYNKFHMALVKLKSDQIGVSFPQCQLKPGHIFRVHGDRDLLIKLHDSNWIGDSANKFQVEDIKQIPSIVKYRTISRVRTNMSKSKLARLKRRKSIHGIDEEKSYKAKMYSRGLINPYFDLKSGSTGQCFRLFIQLGELNDKSIGGTFDSYGLSKTGTVPWFD